MTAAAHGGRDHQWKRGPVTDFTVTYGCECGDRHKVRWASVLPHVSAVDQAVTGAYGGTVMGDSGQPWEQCLARWMLEIDKLGLRLHTEDLSLDGEEP